MAYWPARSSRSFRERLALHCLGLNGFEVYCPRLRQQLRIRGRKVVRTPLLFPSYAFVLIVSQWWNARWSPGVHRIVLDGPQPARVPDQVIAEIRGRERNGLVECRGRAGSGRACGCA
jgi:transcriptional antiterminator RfaH